MLNVHGAGEPVNAAVTTTYPTAVCPDAVANDWAMYRPLELTPPDPAEDWLACSAPV
jgi:hypothetical protein